MTPELAPALNATRFRAAHEGEWARLEALLGTVERRSVRALDDDDLLALPLLYRSALSSLAVARETSLDRALVDYLEQLCARAYFHVYGVRSSIGRQLGDFFARGWPDAVRALWRETVVAALLLLAGAIVGYLLVKHDQSWFYDLVPGEFADTRTPTASVATLRDSLYKGEDDFLGAFAALLFTNNAQVSILAFALGFAFGAPTALLMFFNGISAGLFYAVYAPKGLALGFTAWLAIHGTTELFAIAIAGAAGFRIGTAVAFPGRLGRMEAAMVAGRTAATAMMGVMIMLGVAGLLEGVGRQTVTGDGERLLIGGAALAGWLAYFYLARSRRAAA